MKTVRAKHILWHITMLVLLSSCLSGMPTGSITTSVPIQGISTSTTTSQHSKTDCSSLNAAPQSPSSISSSSSDLAANPLPHWFTLTESDIDDIQTMLVDQQNDIWVGTRRGVRRYNDQSATWTKPLTEGLENNDVRILLQAPNQIIWAGTTSGVNRFNKSTEKWDGFTLNETVTTILTDTSGTLWVGTNNGIRRYHESVGLKGDFEAVEGITNTVTTLLEDTAGTLWAGTSAGVRRYDRTAQKFTSTKGIGNVLALAQDENQDMWVGTDKDVIRYDGTSWRSFTNVDNVAKGRVTALREDSWGNLWVGTDKGGVSRYNGASWQTFTVLDGLASNHITALRDDENGNLWVGTDSGMNYYDGHRWRTFTTFDGLTGNNVRALQLHKGKILVGTSHGISRYDDTTWQSLPVYSGLTSGQIRALMQDHEDSIWIGAANGDISRYDGEVWQSFPAHSQLAEQSVSSFLEDARGHIWVGTQGGGIRRYDGSTWQSITRKNGLANDDVRAMTRDDRGNTIWIGTDGGGIYHVEVDQMDGDKLSPIASKAWQLISTTNLLENYAIQAFVRDRDTIWVGTSGGLMRYTAMGKGTFTKFTKRDGLADNDVRALLLEKNQDKDALWVGTATGLVSRYDIKTGTWLTFTHTQGLPTEQELNLPRRSIVRLLQDKDDHIWIMTSTGVSRYNGAQWIPIATEANLRPDTIVTDLLPDQRLIGTSKGVKRFDDLNGRQLTNVSSNDYIRVLLQDKSDQNRIWAGTDSKGVIQIDGLRSTPLTATKELGSIQALEQDTAKNLWIATTRGVARYAIGTGLQVFTQTKDIDTRILKVTAKHIWAGTGGDGILRYDGSDWQVITTSATPGLLSNSTLFLEEDNQDQTLWVGGDDGALSRYDGQAWHTFPEENIRLPSNKIRALFYITDTNTLWIGTQAGLSRYEIATNIWETFKVKDGLANSEVQAVLLAKNGRIWAATSQGVSYYDSDRSDKRWRSFTRDDGLAGNDARALAEDEDHNIWVATDGGVSRFDGKAWRTFPRNDGSVDTPVYALLQDRGRKYLWLATDIGVGLYDYDNKKYSGQRTPENITAWQTFTMHENLAEDNITTLMRDNDGILWAGAAAGGISRYDGTSWQPFTERHKPLGDNIWSILPDIDGKDIWVGAEGGVSRFDGKTWQIFTTYDGLAGNNIFTLMQDRRDGSILAGTESGVSRFDGKNSNGKPWRSLATNAITNVRSLLLYQDNIILAGTQEGLYRLNDNMWRPFTSTANITSALALLQDKAGHLWVGTDGAGVSYFDGKTWQTFTTTHGLANNEIWALLQDQVTDSIWVGTSGGGVSRFEFENKTKPWTTFTKTDGLINNNVLGLLNTHDQGILAASYNGGISRYDRVARDWKPITSTKDVLDERVFILQKGLNQDIWAGTYGGGVSVSHDDGVNWEPVPPRADQEAARITALVRDENTLWAGSAGGVITSYDITTQESHSYTTTYRLPIRALLAITPTHTIWASTDNGLIRFDSHRFNSHREETFSLGIVTALLEDNQHRLWVGSDNGLSYSNDGRVFVPINEEGLSTESIQGLLEDRDGGIWVATNHGVARLVDGTGWQYVTAQDELTSNNARVLLQDRDGNIWVGMANGDISRYDSTGWKTITGPDNASIQQLLQDTSGAIWAWTAAGSVSRYNGVSWQYFTTDNGLPNTTVALEKDKDGMIWAGSESGISRYDSSIWRTFTSADSQDTFQVSDLLVDRNSNTLWIATDKGVSQYNGKNWRTFTQKDGLIDSSISSLLQASDGAIWAGTDSGLSIYDGVRWGRKITWRDGLVSNRVQALERDDQEQRIWVGTDKGVSMSEDNGESWQTFTTTKDVVLDNIVALLRTDDGTIWAATSDGLSYYRDGSWKTFQQAKGMNVVVMVQDQACNIWFGTRDNGVARWDRAGNWTIFTRANGLLDNSIHYIHETETQGLWFFTSQGIAIYHPDYNWHTLRVPKDFETRNVYASVSFKGDTFWFGTDRGLLRYHPDTSLIQRPVISTIVIDKGKSTEERSQDPSSQIILDAQNSGLSFEFEGRSLGSATSELTLFYRLRHEPDDGTIPWKSSTKSHDPPLFSDVQLLPSPGKYIFEVRMMDRNGLISEPSKSPLIIVNPPLPIVPLSLGTLLGLGGGILAYRRHSARRKARRRFNPYIAGDPIIDPRDFYGRNRVITAILDGIANNHTLLYGGRRIGKTSLLYQLQKRLRDANLVESRYHFEPIYLSLQGVAESRFFARLLERIARDTQIPRHALLLVSRSDSYDNFDAEHDLELVVARLRERTPEKELRIVLLLDEMDHFDRYTPATHEQFRALLQTDAGGQLKVVATGVTISKNTKQSTSPWYNLFGSERELRELRPEDARTLIVEPVREAYAWETAAVDTVLKISHGKPRDLQKLCREAVDAMLDAGRLRITEVDVMTALEIVGRERDDEYRDAWSDLDERQRTILQAARENNGLIASSAYTGSRPPFSRFKLYQFTYIDGDTMRLTYLFSRWLEGLDAESI